LCLPKGISRVSSSSKSSGFILVRYRLLQLGNKSCAGFLEFSRGLLLRRFVRENLFHVHPILLHNDGFAVDYLTVCFLFWHICLHCPAQCSCLPPKINPNPQANHGDDGKNYHRKHESQKQQDRASKKAKKVFKHDGFSVFGFYCSAVTLFSQTPI
jgi:hypothetical protein